MPRSRRTVVLLVTATVGALAVGAAAPSTAGGPPRKVYKASASVSGSATAAKLGALELSDYSDGNNDRIAGTPAKGEVVTVDYRTEAGQVSGTCKTSTYFESGISLFGEDPNWANMGVNSTPQPARLRLNCTLDGVIHHLRWGTTRNAAGTHEDNCARVTRTATDTYAVSTSGCEVAQDEIVSSRGKQLSSQLVDSLKVDVTFKVVGAP